MEISAILFDLDGVLCSTDRFHYRAWKELADRLGLPFNEEINRQLRGVSRMESLEILLRGSERKFTFQEKAALAEEKNRRYRQLLMGLTQADVSPPVRQTLRELRAQGYRQAVASSSRNTPLILQRVGLDTWFDAVIDGNQITRSKPDPEVFLRAAQALGFPPARCLVVEDADAGVEAALRGGFPCAGIGPAARNPNITRPLSSLSQLLQILP